MTSLYVAGPMRGYPSFNVPAFDAATANLRAAGYDVFSPAEHDRDKHGDDIHNSPTGDLADIAQTGFTLRDALATDTAWICANADGIAVLPGWEASLGATAEVALARALGIDVAAPEAWLERVA